MLTDLNGQGIDRVHERRGLNYFALMDIPMSRTLGDEELAAKNGYFHRSCYHQNILLSKFGMLKRCDLRDGNVYSAYGWWEALDPVIAGYANREIKQFVWADAAYEIPAFYTRLESAGYSHANRLPVNAILREKAAHCLTLPVVRPSKSKMRRFFVDFMYEAAYWDNRCRVITKIDLRLGKLYPVWS